MLLVGLIAIPTSISRSLNAHLVSLHMSIMASLNGHPMLNAFLFGGLSSTFPDLKWNVLKADLGPLHNRADIYKFTNISLRTSRMIATPAFDNERPSSVAHRSVETFTGLSRDLP